MPKLKKAQPKETATIPEPVVVEPVERTTMPTWFKWISGLIGVVIALALIVVIGYFSYEYKYTDLAYAGVQLAGQDVGGKNFQAINKLLRDYSDTLDTTGFVFQYDGQTFTIPVTTDAVGIIDIDEDKSLQTAFAVGRGTDAVANAWDKFDALTTSTNIPLIYTLDRAILLEQLHAEFDQYVTPYANAALTITDNDITVTPSVDGTNFDWEAVLNTVEDQVTNLEPVEVALEIQSEDAPITTTEAEAQLSAAEAVLDVAPLTLTYEDNSYEIDRAALGSWLTLSDVNNKVSLEFDEDAMRASLAVVAGEIDVPVQEGKFSLDIVDDTVKLTQFSDGQDGLGVDMDKATADLRQLVLEERSNTIPLTVAVTHPRANPDNLEDLGINELLGTGTTNFSGSPYNRILNIQKGADMLNGLLIAPGETFSLLDILNPIDTAHGWFSELVIKGDKLEKEAGGGLCQVGSTSFRAAMLSGLPIVERRNHSWAISYYAYKGKAGVDATIYDPSPDFKFLNDTGHYILWRSRIEGSDIYFELWGTSDGRKGYFTDPENYNYVSPGPTIETVDPTLPSGTRNCDGHAFTGVTAAFDYIIEQPDGTVDKETFTSVYKARPQLCIVGPDAVAEPAEEETENTESTDTDTTEETNTNTNTNSNTNSGKNKNKNSN